MSAIKYTIGKLYILDKQFSSPAYVVLIALVGTCMALIEDADSGSQWTVLRSRLSEK